MEGKPLIQEDDLVSQTLIEHVLRRLKQLGINDVFGVPGDYSFGISDAICNDPELRWIGSSNELNAAFAADGYARIKGFAALSTTFGVGELGALSGIAGSYTEHLPVFHLVGMPNLKTQREHRIVHHTLGTGEFDLFVKMTQPAVCASAILTPENAAFEMERLINAAISHRRPVYLAIPADHVNATLTGPSAVAPLPTPASNPAAVEEAAQAVAEKLARAKTAAILAGYLILRLGLSSEALALVEATGLPFATMLMDKTALDETHPQYIGIYDGRLMNPEIREFIEGCDCILNLGALWSDFNTGAYTANLNPAKVIEIRHHYVRVGHAVYPHLEFREALAALDPESEQKETCRPPRSTGWASPRAPPVTALRRIISTRVGRNSSGPATSWWPRPAPSPWASVSPACRKARCSSTRPSGLPWVGPPRRPSGRRWPRPAAAPCSSPVKAPISSPSRR